MTVQFRFDQSHTGNTNSHYTKCSIINAFLSFFEWLAWQITLYFILLTCVRCNSKTSWISENDWPKCVSVSWVEFELIWKSSTFVWNFQNFGQASEIETCYDQDSNESTWIGTEKMISWSLRIWFGAQYSFLIIQSVCQTSVHMTAFIPPITV